MATGVCPESPRRAHEVLRCQNAQITDWGSIVAVTDVTGELWKTEPVPIVRLG